MKVISFNNAVNKTPETETQSACGAAGREEDGGEDEALSAPASETAPRTPARAVALVRVGHPSETVRDAATWAATWATPQGTAPRCARPKRLSRPQIAVCLLLRGDGRETEQAHSGFPHGRRGERPHRQTRPGCRSPHGLAIGARDGTVRNTSSGCSDAKACASERTRVPPGGRRPRAAEPPPRG